MQLPSGLQVEARARCFPGGTIAVDSVGAQRRFRITAEQRGGLVVCRCLLSVSEMPAYSWRLGRSQPASCRWSVRFLSLQFFIFLTKLAQLFNFCMGLILCFYIPRLFRLIWFGGAAALENSTLEV